MSFSELKCKDVVNICDGHKLGKPIDLLLNDKACADALVVPGQGSFWCVFKPDRDGLVIPWNRIRRIGEDVILVELEDGWSDRCH